MVIIGTCVVTDVIVFAFFLMIAMTLQITAVMSVTRHGQIAVGAIDA